MHDSLLIQNGRVLDPASGFDAVADVLINDGVVVAIETSIDATAYAFIDNILSDPIASPLKDYVKKHHVFNEKMIVDCNFF